MTQRMKSYKENNQEIFIRSYTLDDGSPKVIAFADKQLEDLANFCCSDKNQFKSMLFIDITFQLGPFYHLLTAYQNTTLFVKATEGCPTMIGPLTLCMLKDECTYLTLFQKMTAHISGLKDYTYRDMLQTTRNHLEMHLLTNFLLQFHTFVLYMQKRIFQRTAANLFYQKLCHHLGLHSKSTSLSPGFCVHRPRQYNMICWKFDLISGLFFPC